MTSSGTELTGLLQEWEEHVRNAHYPKRKDCSICQAADGPVELRHTKQRELSAAKVLHVDLAGPFVEAEPDQGR